MRAFDLKICSILSLSKGSLFLKHSMPLGCSGPLVTQRASPVPASGSWAHQNFCLKYFEDEKDDLVRLLNVEKVG